MELKNFFHMGGNRKTTGFVALSLSLFLLAGCTESKTPTGPYATTDVATETDVAAIEAVILKEFSGPDEAYRELLDEAMEAQTSVTDQAEFEVYKDSPVYLKFMDYMELTYAPYFTDNGYQAFINAVPAFKYHGFEGKYTLSVSDITFSQNDNNRTLYHFSFPVILTDASGKAEVFEFNGKAIVPNPGKIGSIEFRDVNNLWHVLTLMDDGAFPFHTERPSVFKVDADKSEMALDSAYEESCWNNCKEPLTPAYVHVFPSDVEVGDQVRMDWSTLNPKPDAINLIHFDEQGEVLAFDALANDSLTLTVEAGHLGKRYGVQFLWKDGETTTGHGLLSFLLQ